MKRKFVSRLLAGCLTVTLLMPSAALAASPVQTGLQTAAGSGEAAAAEDSGFSGQANAGGETSSELQNSLNHSGSGTNDVQGNSEAQIRTADVQAQTTGNSTDSGNNTNPGSSTNAENSTDSGNNTNSGNSTDSGSGTNSGRSTNPGSSTDSENSTNSGNGTDGTGSAGDNTPVSGSQDNTAVQEPAPSAGARETAAVGWKKEGDRWTYYQSDGTVLKEKFVQVDGEWYYFDKDGWMVTGWQKIENKWYYFHSSGKRMTGWQWVGSKCYYMDENGVMAADTWIGQYYVDASGAWIPGKVKVEAGWVKSGSRWWYRHADGGYTKSGWELINGKWYYFDGDGWMVTGWRLVTGTWYYLDGSGAMLTGWQKIGGTWYYLDGSGAMLTGWQKLGGIWYYLNGSGAMLTGWQKLGGIWYYLDGSGAMLTGWQKLGGVWYYLNESGAMLTGWQKISGSWYYLNGSGAMLTGWQKIGESWYYLYENGKMAADTWIGSYYVNTSGAWEENKTTNAGWVQSGGRWYYDNGDGTRPKSTWKTIDDAEYYFDADGWMVTGWLKLGTVWYYLKSDGSKAYDYWVGKTGVGGYYISKYGRMVAGTTYSYGNYIYTFDENGLCTGSETRYVRVTDPKNGKTYTVEKQYETDPKVGVDITEDELLAATVYAEAGNQGMPGMTGVALVMLNRMYSGTYPASADIMIYQQQQFEVARNGSLTRYLKNINSSLLDNAKEAVTRARAIMDAYQTSGTPRTVEGLTMPEGKTDFDYMGFMTPAAFENAGLDWDKTYAFTYLNTTFYTAWILKK